jgi:Flp pilus assembly protein TadD
MAPHASQSNCGITDALRLVGTATWRYVAMLAWPHPLNMFQTMDSATGLPAWIPLVVVPVVMLIAVRQSVSWTAALFVLFVPLAPALYAPVLLPGLDNPWAERYAYLPSAGFVVGIAAVIGRLHHRPAAWLARTATLVIPLAFAGLTVARIPVWHDDLTLWSDTVAKSPRAGAAHGALGYALYVRGDTARAIAEYRTAIRLKPDHADSHLNLGVALASIGDHRAAVIAYGENLRLQPRNALVRANMAISLSALGFARDAIVMAREAVALQPGLATAHQALGVAFGNAGALAEAVVEFREAVRLDPSDITSRQNLDKAEAHLRRLSAPRADDGGQGPEG